MSRQIGSVGRGYWHCFVGIVFREMRRFWSQKARFFSALVRPLLWLIIFAAGFRSVLGVSIIPPYQTYILYEEYIVPGLVAMTVLFISMQSALSMIYDKEVGSMRVMLTSPFPRWFLLTSRLFASVVIGLLQSALFLAIAYFWDVQPPWLGYLCAIPAILLAGVLLGSIGLLLSSWIKQLENFAGVMNFVIFPMFFTSSALYPLWRIKDVSPWLYQFCQWNPFTHAVEIIRFALYLQINWFSLGYVLIMTAIFLSLALWSYDPVRGNQPKSRGKK